MSKLGEIFTPDGLPAGHVGYRLETSFEAGNFPPEVPSLRPVVLQPHPFSQEVMQLEIPEGATLLDMVEGAQVARRFLGFVRVYIEDMEVDRRYWGQVRPKAGKQVYIRVVPQGGGGGDGGRKNVLASVLMIAVAVTAAWAGPFVAGSLLGLQAGTFGFAVASGLVGAGVSMLGSLLISALIPPPDTGPEVGQRALLSGVRNRLQPYATIPRIFGERRVYPLQAARPYTEAAGKNRWVRVLLAVGFGPLQISQIKIGDTPIGLFENIKYEVREGWRTQHANFGSGAQATDARHKLFTQSVKEQTFAQYLPPTGSGAGPWYERTTEVNTEEASIDISAPYGIADLESDGSKSSLTVEVEVQWRAVGSAGAWTQVVWDGNDEADGTQTNGKVILKDDQAEAMVMGGRWEFPAAGQYTVRCRRLSGEGPGPTENAERVEWTALRSITGEYPIQEPGVATIALKIKLTDTFTSIPDTINCVAKSYLPVWSGSAWSWQISRNPAWAFADVLRRRGIRWQLRDKRLDLAAIRDWALAADNPPPQGASGGTYWTFDSIMEGGSVWQALRRIASHARADYVLKDGLHSIVRDVEQLAPVQHITPRNSWGYRGSKAFADLPHALKVQFVNSAMGWQEDEAIVYAPGYDAATADRFESLDLPDCTRHGQAQREGKYHLAVGKFRQEEHSVYMDIEHLRCTKGDRVQFAHDVISEGLGSGRIVATTVNGSGNITQVTLESDLTLNSNNSHALRVRMRDGDLGLYTLAGVGSTGTYSTVTLSPAIPSAGGPKAGDLYTIGRTNNTTETLACLVKKIEPGPDLTALVTLIPYHLSVNQSDTGTLEPHTPIPQDPDPPDQKKLPKPVFAVSSGNEAALILEGGEVIQRLMVTIKPSAPGKVEVTGHTVQVRSAGQGQYHNVNNSPANETVLRFYHRPVKKGQRFDIRVKARGKGDTDSDWEYLLGYTIVGRGQKPPAPTGLFVDGRNESLVISWNKVTFQDLDGYDLFESTTSTPAPTDTSTPTFSLGKSNVFTRGGLGSSETRSYWVRARSKSGNTSAWSARAQGTTYANRGVTAQTLAGLVNEVAFASGITAPLIVTSLPTSGNYEGRLAFLTTQGKLYRYTGGAWTAAVDGADLTANSITAGKIAVGAIGADQIAAGAVTTEKLILVGQDNLLPQGLFVSSAQIAAAYNTGANVESGVGGPRTGRYSLALTVTSTGASRHCYIKDEYLVDVEPGEKLYLETALREGNGITRAACASVGLRFYDSAGAYITGSTSGTGPLDLTGSWRTEVREVTVPSGATRMGAIVDIESAMPVGTSVRCDRIFVRRRDAAKLIVDGGITADKVGANRIITNAANIQDAVISTIKLGAQSISVRKSVWDGSAVDFNGSFTGTKDVMSMQVNLDAHYDTDIFMSFRYNATTNTGGDWTSMHEFEFGIDGSGVLRTWDIWTTSDERRAKQVALMLSITGAYGGVKRLWGRLKRTASSGQNATVNARYMMIQQVKR